MSWLELDDRILEHPKFIRAVNVAGSDAIHLWLGLRAYCGQLLTDGLIPADMIPEVRGPKDARRRAGALKALLDVVLLHQVDDGALMMHDYLDWSSSRDVVLARRESARDRQRRSRGSSTLVTRDSRGTSAAVTNPRARGSSPLPSDLPSAPLPEERELRAPARLAAPAKIWNSGEWLRRFGFAWMEQYQEHTYPGGSDKTAERRLDGILNELPTVELLAAQENAPRMFAEFLAIGEERTVDRRHPFSFFVQVWKELRVEKRGTDWPVSFAERKRQQAKEDAQRFSEAQVRATEAKIRELQSVPLMSPVELAAMHADIRSLTDDKAAVG